MLPYMPLHSDWFERLDTPALVMTSGNISECPITITPEEAEKQLAGKIPLLLHHNRWMTLCYRSVAVSPA